ncbi:MAG TPA: AcrB/AcrD/AcrF family protein [Rhodospirillaceae bacterium]|jgi:multidrug efflux pump subunit AcrB|nr:AcrB/AcrD/AcrF family protein [Rhodospirillaceae bacterium]
MDGLPMNLTALALRNPVATWLAVVLLLLAGWASYDKLGKLEDPEFTVKTASITTAYPGASAVQVEQEVTERIALAAQKVPEVDYIKSISMPHLSIVKVEIKSQYWSAALPQIWDTLRRKIREMEGDLPQGAGRPAVGDDFGDVYGFVLAVTGDGFTYKELEGQVKNIKRRLSLVEGVGRVEYWGKRPRAVYVEVSEARLAGTGITVEDIAATLGRQNATVRAGSVYADGLMARIEVTGALVTPADVGDLIVRGAAPGQGDKARPAGEKAQDALIRIRDIAEVREDFVEPAPQIMFYDGQPAIGLAVANVRGANIITLGENLDAALSAMEADLPVGLEVHRVAWQAGEVSVAINSFVVSLIQALVIVLVVLALAMGWRMGTVIGTALLLTIAGTMVVMDMMSIDLQRMSLGALIIAMGMMVDNAIVVADGFAVRLARGMGRREAAIEAATQPSIPLLGATIIAVLAFYPIGGSPDSTGEYCLSLFQVVGISLLLSWIVSITVTPLQCVAMLPQPTQEAKDPYGGTFFRAYRALLEWTLRRRALTLASMVGLLVLSGVGFGAVPQMFFPDSSRAQFMVDMYPPTGTRVTESARLLEKARTKIQAMDGVVSVASFVGSGPPRFYLPVEPEMVSPAYGQMIVTVADFRKIDAMRDEIQPWLDAHFPEVVVFRMRKYAVGPGNTWSFELRVTAPPGSTPDEVRAAVQGGLDVLEASPLVAAARVDWRERVPKVVVGYSQERGRWAGVSRADTAQAAARAFDGQGIGQFRERDELMPILLRNAGTEREDPSTLYAVQIPQAGPMGATVPLTQVARDVEISWEDTAIWGRNRLRTISLQAAPEYGVTTSTLKAAVEADLAAWAETLPPGYSAEWGGEIESSAKAQGGLVPGIIPAATAMVFILVALFGALRPAAVIVLTIPLAAIGITAALLGTGAAFGFMALLGAMSLAGMMIKNAIVLIDEIALNRGERGMETYDAIVAAGLSRLRPVMLAAATTVLGVIPLIPDVFWSAMAVTIMGGLAFGTVLTMVVVPVLYAALYRVRAP